MRLYDLTRSLVGQGVQANGERPLRGAWDALRDALLITQLLALIVVVLHLVTDHLTLVMTLPAISIEGLALLLTWRWLKK